MRRVFINVEECEPGMQIAENIYNSFGAVIVYENSILDEHVIRKLKNLDIRRLKIYDIADNIITANSSEVFKIQYNENVDAVKDVLHEISDGKQLDIKKVNLVSDSLYEKINENRDIINCFNQIRTADEYTYTHSVNVSLLSMLICKWLKMDPRRIKEVVQAGLLHDIGKVKIDSRILNKPGKLSEDEFAEIKKHPIYGYRMLDKMPEISDLVRKTVLMHHERDDGSGYPVGISGEVTPIYAKIVAVADIYDAMTSERIYKGKTSPFDVFELIEKDTFGVLDPRVTNAFLSNIAAYYLGDFVRLSTGELGEIIYINPRHISQPLIKIGTNFVDLSINVNVKIVELI